MKAELPRPPNREIGKLLTELFADKREITKQVIESQLTELRSKRQAEVVSIEPALRVSGETPVEDRTSQVDDILPFEATQVAPSTNGAPMSRAKPPAEVKTKTGLVGALVALLAVCGAAAFLFFRHPAPEVVAVRSIAITLRATPPETKFSIDNGAEQPNPFSGSLPQDSLTHTVKASAPGYTTKTETLSFEQDVSMRFSLARESRSIP